MNGISLNIRIGRWLISLNTNCDWCDNCCGIFSLSHLNRPFSFGKFARFAIGQIQMTGTKCIIKSTVNMNIHDFARNSLFSFRFVWFLRKKIQNFLSIRRSEFEKFKFNKTNLCSKLKSKPTHIVTFSYFRGKQINCLITVFLQCLVWRFPLPHLMPMFLHTLYVLVHCTRIDVYILYMNVW